MKSVVVEVSPHTRQREFHECPDRCHICRYMGGAVMPHCMGTIQGTDELDLSRCCCETQDPVVRQSDLAFYARHLLECLRDRRRGRALDRNIVRHLRQTVSFLRFADATAMRRGLADVESLCGQLLCEWPDEDIPPFPEDVPHV